MYLAYRHLLAAIAATTLASAADAQSPLHRFDPTAGSVGFSASGGWDIDGIEGPDIVVSSRGEVFVYGGKTGQLVHRWTGSGNRLGWSVCSTGDLDGDGRGDVIAGAPFESKSNTNEGAVYAFSGMDGSQLWRKSGSAADDRFGASVARLADIDNDGVAEILVGAVEFNSGAGRVEVRSGATGAKLFQVSEGDPGDQFGTSVASAGRVDNDNFEDFLVGAIARNQGRGTGYVFSGKNGDLIRSHDGLGSGTSFGQSVDGLGDVDGDAVSDYLISSQGESESGGDYTGSVRVFSGKMGGQIQALFGTQKLSVFGWSARAAGDMDGDGIPEIAVGVRGLDHLGGSDSGAVEIYKVDGTRLYSFSLDEDGAMLGSSVADAGDVDGDGFADVIAGAQGSSAALVLGGADLTLNVHPDLIQANESLTLVVEGEPLRPLAIFITEVQAVPLFQLALLSMLPGSGRFEVTTPLPPGQPAVDLKLRAYSLDFSGDVLRGNYEMFRMR